MGKGEFDPFQSKLRLFMSVDIVGSTAFKQSDSGQQSTEGQAGQLPSETWFSPIAQFYRQIELLFSEEWRIYFDVHSKIYGHSAGSAPSFWKGIGDEVVYYKEITHHQEAHICINCWINVVNKYRRILKAKYPKLDVKSAAWIAGFPVSNAEIIFRTRVEEVLEAQGGSDPVYDNAQLLIKYYNGQNDGLLRDFIDLVSILDLGLHSFRPLES